MKVHLTAMALFKIRNKLLQLLVMDFLIAISGLTRGTLLLLAGLTNDFFAAIAFLQIQWDLITAKTFEIIKGHLKVLMAIWKEVLLLRFSYQGF